MIIKPIHDVDKQLLKSFSCGDKNLDKFLKKYALINDENGYSKTSILIDDNEMIGFFTLCSASISFEEMPNDQSELLPKYPIPCVRIARLGVRKDKQGKGYSKELLKQAFIKIVSVSAKIGIRLIIADAKETSASFYEKYGFLKLLSNGLSYYLPIDTLKAAITNAHQKK